MSQLFLSFKEWPYPHSSKCITRFCASESGFIAYSIKNSMCVLGFDRDEFSTIDMWSPSDSDVISIEWVEDAMSGLIVSPIIAVGLDNCGFMLYQLKELRTRKLLCSYNFQDEKIISIKNVPLKKNTFYLGCDNGHFMLTEIKDQKMIISRAYMMQHPINFIAIQPCFGDKVATISLNGNISVVQNDKLIIENFPLSKVPFIMKKSSNVKVNSLEFYGDSDNFLIITLASMSVIFGIKEAYVVEFISRENLLNVYPIYNNFITVENDVISMYRYKKQKIDMSQSQNPEATSSKTSPWIRVSEISSSGVKFEKTCCVNNVIFAITKPLSIYVIELFRKKLFVTKIISLLNTSPMDWSFWKGSIAITTNTGQLLVTIPVRASCPDTEFTDNDFNNTVPFDNDFIKDDQTSIIQCGNSCNFLYKINISNFPMSVEWISRTLLVLWSQVHKQIFIVNLDTKTQKNIFKKNSKKEINFSISQIFVSTSKTYLCSVINKTRVSVFRCPELEEHRQIFLEKESFGTFSNDGSILFFISSNNDLCSFRSDTGELLAKRNFQDLFSPTTIVCSFNEDLTNNQKDYCYIGDKNGDIARYKFNRKKLSLKLDKKVFVNENDSQEPITKIVPCKDALLIIRRENTGYVIQESNNNTVELTRIVEYAKFAFGKTVLVKFAKAKKLIAFPLFGKLTRYKSPVWYRNRMLDFIDGASQNPYLNNQRKGKYDDLFNVIHYGIPFAFKIGKFSNKSLQKQTEILLHYISNYPKLNESVFYVSTISNNKDVCMGILKRTSQKSQDFLINVLLLALYDITNPGKAFNKSIKILEGAGYMQYAYLLLAMTHQYQGILDLLIKNKEYKTAYFYVRNQSFKFSVNGIQSNSDTESEDTKVLRKTIKELGNSLKEQNFPVLPIILFVQLGMFSELCQYINELQLDDIVKKEMINYIIKKFY